MSEQNAAPEASGSVEAIGLTKEQRSALPPFAMIRAFEAVGTLGGIRRAAAALSVDHAAVSRHLRALEQWTGTSLVDRTQGAGGQLTPRGRVFHRRVTQALVELAGATQDICFRTDENRLRLWCMPGLASEWLMGRIGDFAGDHPEIDIELQPSDVPPNFDTQQADAYLHYVIDNQGPSPDPKLREAQIARPPVLAVASPGYLSSVSPFEAPADLLRSTLLHEANDSQWRRWLAQHAVEVDGDIKGPKYWQGHLTLAAARRGQGVALSNALLVFDDLRDGRLVAVGNWQPVYLGSYLFTTRTDGWRSRTIASFRRWLEKAVAENLDGVLGSPVRP